MLSTAGRGSGPCGRRSRGRRGPRARAGRGSRGACPTGRRTRRTGGRAPAWRRPRRPAMGSAATSRPWSAGPRPSLGVVGDLLGAAGAAERVDARVLGDLVDPGLEGDRPLGLAHAAQRGDEDLLRDVLGAAVVLDHAEHVGVDAALVAPSRAPRRHDRRRAGPRRRAADPIGPSVTVGGVDGAGASSTIVPYPRFVPADSRVRLTATARAA